MKVQKIALAVASVMTIQGMAPLAYAQDNKQMTLAEQEMKLAEMKKALADLKEDIDQVEEDGNGSLAVTIRNTSFAALAAGILLMVKANNNLGFAGVGLAMAGFAGAVASTTALVFKDRSEYNSVVRQIELLQKVLTTDGAVNAISETEQKQLLIDLHAALGNIIVELNNPENVVKINQNSTAIKVRNASLATLTIAGGGIGLIIASGGGGTPTQNGAVIAVAGVALLSALTSSFFTVDQERAMKLESAAMNLQNRVAQRIMQLK